MNLKRLYAQRHEPGLQGIVVRSFVFVFLRLRPPPPYREHDAESKLVIANLKTDAEVLMLGSNVSPDTLRRRGYQRAVQLDIKQYENVDLVADAESMSDSIHADTFDYVISTSMIEHTRHPWLVFSEAFKVLKPGGLMYVDAPWMYPLHGEPHDFFRFSEQCLRNLAEDAGFTVVESGCNVSGHGAMYALAHAYLSEVLSFDRPALYYSWQYLLLWPLLPFGCIERLWSMRRRDNRFTDSIVYVAARKPEVSSDRSGV